MVTEREREDAKRTLDRWARETEANRARNRRQAPADLKSLLPKGPIATLLGVVAVVAVIGVIATLISPNLVTERAVERKPGCDIKGNISGSGRIYHVPGSHNYDRTRIDTEYGERWFCTEEEAVEAGWRAPRNQ